MKTNLLNVGKCLVAVGMLASSCVLQSCLDDDDNNSYMELFPNALVTVKPVDGGSSFFMQLDDTTTLLPANMDASPYGEKEVRALVNFEESSEPAGEYTKAVQVNWIDSILTKAMAPDLELKNDSVYGTDPVEIVNDWVTIAEDGYLTLRFRTELGEKHFVNLLAGQNPENPYEVEFRHNAFGNFNGPAADGLVAFRLDSLPDTEGKTVKLTLKWHSYSGDKSAEFDYCTRKSTPASASVAKERCVLNLE